MIILRIFETDFLGGLVKLKAGVFSVLLIIFLLLPMTGNAQINEDKLGAWYMYFFNSTFNDGRWGIQGDVQSRNWNIVGDLEQLMLRGGITYKPKSVDVKLTLGYGNITTGLYGSDNSKTTEHRIYQEALIPIHLGGRFYTNHRFRYEQRFVENQDTRTRYRYNLFLNIPVNSEKMDERTFYLAFYNELFINGQRKLEKGIETFDRNRLYGAVGYVIKKGLNIQIGLMNQTTNNWNKNQLQFSIHHKI